VMKKVWELAPGIAMLGVGSSAGHFSKREKGRTRSLFWSLLKQTRAILPR